MNAIVILPEDYDELLVLNSKNEIRGQSKTQLYGGKVVCIIVQSHPMALFICVPIWPQVYECVSA